MGRRVWDSGFRVWAQGFEAVDLIWALGHWAYTGAVRLELLWVQALRFVPDPSK